MARNNPYFSIVPSPAAGLTDQLGQFRVFYKLGQSLGYTYWHQPFFSRRTTLAARHYERTLSPFYRKRSLGLRGLLGRRHRLSKPRGPVLDVYDFIGINEHFLAKNEQRGIGEPKVIEMKLGDELLERLDITDLAELQDLVRRMVAETDARARTALVEFALFGTRAFFRFVNAEIPDHPADFDLRSIYFEKRSAHPWPSLFPRDAVRTLVHVRQGDTATLETPWHTVISLWPREYQFKEYASFDDMPAHHRVLRVEDFHEFLREFAASIGEPMSTLLFSDGFKRSLHKLNRQSDVHGLTPRQLEALNKTVGSFDKTRFKPFKDLDNCDLFVGEEPEKLFHLIHSFLQADLVVIGPQGSLIPSLIRHYCDVQNMPIVLVLSRSNELMSKAFGGLNKTGKVFFVNTSQPNYGDLAARVGDLLANRVRARNI